jgi:uncharacterized protein (TIGR00251 family)
VPVIRPGPDHASALIDVLVQPRASRAKIGPVHGDRLKVAVTAPPVEGAANTALVEILAKRLAVSKSRVEVVSGHGSRRKTLCVHGLTAAQVQALLM